MSRKPKNARQRQVRLSWRSFWKRLRRHWVMKVLCLFLAFAVWQGIRESTSFEMLVADIPVTVVPGEGFAVLGQSTDLVSIRFRGSRDEIRLISRDQVSVEVLMDESLGALRQEVKFVPRFVKAPSHAHAVHFYPPEVTITVDREVERLLPVKAVLEGELPEGVRLDNAVCNPASVRVRGAERRLLDMEQVRTEPIRMNDQYDSFGTHVAVAVNGALWSVTPDRIAVEVNLSEHVATRRIEQKPVRPLRATDDTRVIKIKPDRVDVILRGTPQKIEKLKARDVYTYIDCTELTAPTAYEMPVRVDVPPGVHVERIEPAVVQVTVKNL